MDEQELRVFIDIVSQYFERQTGRLPEIGSPYLGEANALPIYDFTGVIGISGERQGCVYFTAPLPLIRSLLRSPPTRGDGGGEIGDGAFLR